MSIIKERTVNVCKLGCQQNYAEDIDKYIDSFFKKVEEQPVAMAASFRKYFQKKDIQFKFLWSELIRDHVGLCVYYINRRSIDSWNQYEIKAKTKKGVHYVFSPNTYLELYINAISYLFAWYGRKTHLFQIRLLAIRIALHYFAPADIDWKAVKNILQQTPNFNYILIENRIKELKLKKSIRKPGKKRGGYESKSTQIDPQEIISLLASGLSKKSIKTALATKYNVSEKTIQNIMSENKLTRKYKKY